MTDDKRFEFIFHQDEPSFSILVDKHTGVNYLYKVEGYKCVAITVLVDKDGKPIVTPVKN